MGALTSKRLLFIYLVYNIQPEVCQIWCLDLTYQKLCKNDKTGCQMSKIGCQNDQNDVKS